MRNRIFLLLVCKGHHTPARVSKCICGIAKREETKHTSTNPDPTHPKTLATTIPPRHTLFTPQPPPHIKPERQMGCSHVQRHPSQREQQQGLWTFSLRRPERERKCRTQTEHIEVSRNNFGRVLEAIWHRQRCFRIWLRILSNKRVGWILGDERFWCRNSCAHTH